MTQVQSQKDLDKKFENKFIKLDDIYTYVFIIELVDL